MRHSEAIARLESWPTTRLASLPTPLLAAPRLAEKLAASPIYVKMDAETGFALGGNKVRKLEFELSPDRLVGVTCLITAGGPQSNHCRVTAAFAARYGLRCVLVVPSPAPESPTGNALLHRLFGAEFELVDDRADRVPGMARVAERIRSEGGRPLVVPIGASTALGTLGYARASIEVAAQLGVLQDGCTETLVFAATSSGGTLAGLVLGLALLDRPDVHLFGVSADAPAAELHEKSVALASEGAALLGAATDLARTPFTVLDDQVGGGYAVPTPASEAAIAIFATLEGIVLDPTYTAKAAAGMRAWIEGNGLAEGQRIVFLHTGGAPGLLA